MEIRNNMIFVSFCGKNRS